MRIVAGEWRGRPLAAPSGRTTRPTADRVRQALFDMLQHAPWGGRASLEGARVLDAFAGTGALGLEALSRGAAHATFVERDRAAVGALRANVARCGAEGRSTILARDVLAVRPDPGFAGSASARIRAVPREFLPGSGLAGSVGQPGSGLFDLVFLDPPYGEDLIARALDALRAAGWVGPQALVVAETAREEEVPGIGEPLARRSHGAASLTIWREVAADSGGFARLPDAS